MTSATIVGVVVGYLIILLAIGVWGGRESGDLKGYYVAGKKLPAWVIAFSSNATGESAWLLLGLTGMGYAIGVHAFWIIMGEVLGVAAAWVFVVFRALHSAVHCSVNIVMLRFSLYLVSALGSALAPEPYTFAFMRFIGGLGVGGSSVVAPMYIAEISPAKVRGRLVALAQFNIVFGILLAFCSNYLIGSLGLGDIEWRWMFGVEAIPAAAFFFLLRRTPRSPRWLLARGQEEEARLVLERVGVDTEGEGVDAEIREIKASLDLERHNLREPFFQRKYMTPILLAVAIAAFNQLSGINAILYYSRRVFESAGFGESASLLNSVGLGAVNLVFTIAALSVIDHFGRKKLMLVGSIGYIISLGVTAAAFYTQSSLIENEEGEMVRQFTQSGGWVVFVSLLVFIASHAFGQGAVIWVFLSEIFPNRIRARGQALGSFTHWFMAAAISWTFPMFAQASGGHTFAFYAVMMVLQLIWVLRVMPETKGVALEDIQKRLGIA